jgi:catechol 2,3-dioxygenase-like lactoylglutathione lyase family enzyme
MFRLELFVKNLHTSRYFYENVLGFPVESSRENTVLLRYGSFQLFNYR